MIFEWRNFITAVLCLGMASCLAACSTSENIQGQWLFAEIEPLENSSHYQGGFTSLPAARLTAQTRAQIILEESNRESRIRSGAGGYAFASGITALGLSIAGEGTADLFTFLGLSGASAVAGSNLYANRERQKFLDDSARTLNCLISATDPYFISNRRAAALFGHQVEYSGPTLQTLPFTMEIDPELPEDQAVALVTEALRQERHTAAMLPNLREAIAVTEREVNTADALLRSFKANREGLVETDFAALETNFVALEQAIIQAETALVLSRTTAEDLVRYRADVEAAGAQLANAMRDLILFMSAELRRYEPDADAAAGQLSAIRAGLSAAFGDFDGAAFRDQISALSIQPAEDEEAIGDVRLSSGANADQIAANRRASLVKLNAQVTALAERLTELTQSTRPVIDELVVANRLKESASQIKACSFPVPASALTVTPPNTVQTLGAGKSTTLVATVAVGQVPVVTAVDDTSNLLTFTPDSTPSDGRHEIKVTAADAVEKPTLVRVNVSVGAPRRPRHGHIELNPSLRQRSGLNRQAN